MNIIRTTAVELTVIPAIAYKQKLASGGAGVKLFRLDADANAVFTIDKRTGDALPYGKYDDALFPDEAVLEALELTSGLPYTARGKLKITMFEETAQEEEEAGGEGAAAEEEDAVTEDEAEKVDMVDSEEYRALTLRYTNEKGKINYTLMNKDFIQFASKSSVVSDMVRDRAKVEDIILFLVKSRVAMLSGRKDSMSDAETIALIETMDEIDPRSSFKELSAYIKRLLAKTK